MANFEQAFNITMGHEGGYANDKDDKGGETYRGVARNHWPNWKGWKIIDKVTANNLPLSELNKQLAKDSLLQSYVKEFYKQSFWDVNKLDLVKYQSIANELFDTGVNMGTKKAALMLQEALNLCNKNQQIYIDIAVDGQIGELETLPILNNKANEKAIYNTLNMLQGERYLEIMRSNKTQEKFFPGWLKRIILK